MFSLPETNPLRCPVHRYTRTITGSFAHSSTIHNKSALQLFNVLKAEFDAEIPLLSFAETLQSQGLLCTLSDSLLSLKNVLQFALGAFHF